MIYPPPTGDPFIDDEVAWVAAYDVATTNAARRTILAAEIDRVIARRRSPQRISASQGYATRVKRLTEIMAGLT